MLEADGAAMAALRAAGLDEAELLFAAEAADSTLEQPHIRPNSPAFVVRRSLTQFECNRGPRVAALLRQLARDLQAGRKTSYGVEYTPNHPVDLDGESTFLSMALVHRLKALTVGRDVPLCLIDADAVSGINRVIFGSDLRKLELPVKRRGYVTQCCSAALAKSYLLPEDYGQQHNADQGIRLRNKISAFVAAKVRNGPFPGPANLGPSACWSSRTNRSARG